MKDVGFPQNKEQPLVSPGLHVLPCNRKRVKENEVPANICRRFFSIPQLGLFQEPEGQRQKLEREAAFSANVNFSVYLTIFPVRLGEIRLAEDKTWNIRT